MKKISYYIKEVFSSIIILILSFGVSLRVQEVLGTHALIPSVFALAVFLISVITDGYIYGIISSLLSVLAVNYAFTFPYFKFNFSIPENMISAVIMLAVTTITSAMTTKIKRQEKERAETEKEKIRANLLRAISHDLRTPLTAIYGSSSAIMDNYDGFTEEQKKKLLKGIQEDSRWLIRMVENLLSVTRVDGGKVNLIKTPTVLEELLDAVLIEFHKRYQGQDVAVEIPDEFIIIPMDAMLIQQVLLNILENAVIHADKMTRLSLKVYLGDGKSSFDRRGLHRGMYRAEGLLWVSSMYAHTGGQVSSGRVSPFGDARMHAHTGGQTSSDRVWFEVSDNGCGISEEAFAHLFKGYQGGKDGGTPIDKQRNNMGIGLSTCAAIIKAHSGEIYAANRKDGGACFRFFLDMETEKDE